MSDVNTILQQQQTSKLDVYTAMIENVIRSLGIDPAACREKNRGQWTLQRGSVRVYIDIYNVNGTDYICVASPVMEMPSKMLLPFYRKLLELNHDMYAASFSLKENWVWLRILRELEGLDQNEATAMINRVGAYADQFDEMLISEFKKE